MDDTIGYLPEVIELSGYLTRKSYKHVMEGQYVGNFTISNHTVRKHEILGWYSIGCILDKDWQKRYDVFPANAYWSWRDIYLDDNLNKFKESFRIAAVMAAGIYEETLDGNH